MRSVKASSAAVASPQPASVSLGDNPVNQFRAREYARESSPSILSVLLDLTENGRDNGTDVVLSIDVDSWRTEGSDTILVPHKITCIDNGTGLSHTEFLNRFCGAFQESDAHYDVDLAGRNGVGTKTYLSIANTVFVRTTTARPTAGLDEHACQLRPKLPSGVNLPADGDADTLWRAYEFVLHTRSALPAQWARAGQHEMGTTVVLNDIFRDAEIKFEATLERLSFARGWLQNTAHSFKVRLTGNVPKGLKKEYDLRSWNFPVKNWLAKATGESDKPLTIFDPTTEKDVTIEPLDPRFGVIKFDFRIVDRDAGGKMQLDKPVLLLEICRALPYPPDLDGVLSARTSPLLIFVGLEHASSIGSFYTAVSGCAQLDSISLKQMLRNNKTTLASGPGTEAVEAMRIYLHKVLQALHRIWYNATRSSSDQVARDAVKDAQTEVNFAVKGANRNPFSSGTVVRSAKPGTPKPQPPARRHRWECGACEKRWLADAGLTPSVCGESAPGKISDGCGSTNIGLAKNQPRIGDCVLKLEALNEPRLPASFQFERLDSDVDVPVVRINIVGPRFVELRGTGPSMSGQAQQRLKQYLIDQSLMAIAQFQATASGGDLMDALGELYFNRMLRSTGAKQYDSQVKKIMSTTASVAEAKTEVEALIT